MKLPTESVLESNVSTFERHFHKGRPLTESNREDEMEVAMNGPKLVESDKLLRRAMDLCWDGKRWHFQET